MADLSDTAPVFRATKRRKVFRTRTDSDHDTPSSTTAILDNAPPDAVSLDTLAQASDHTNNDTPTMDLLRQRRLLKGRRGGIAFNQEQSRALEQQTTSQELMLVEAPSASASAVSRFAAETGQRTVSNDSVMLVSS